MVNILYFCNLERSKLIVIYTGYLNECLGFPFVCCNIILWCDSCRNMWQSVKSCCVAITV
uniref:Uncharacterized protein n=1 Tax=Arundo donax TaxID=35708 RepID=A0A0A9AYW8_ARUDO